MLQAPDEAQGPALSPTCWRVQRLSAGFVLDTVQISRGGGDVVSPLIFTAILQANLAPINHDPKLQLAYAGLESAAPDDLRRPVSINAVAQSLNLPFETVRRRVGELVQAGACVITSQGVYAPKEAVTSERYNALQQARYERLRRFYLDLKAVGVTGQAGEGPLSEDGVPARLVNRILSEYMLRVSADLMGLFGGPVNGLAMLQLALENTESVAAETLASNWGEGLTPARVSVLGARLNLPAETVRRHLGVLEAQGFCRRTPRGLLATVPPHAAAEVRKTAENNTTNMRRMFGRLDQMGVLALWEAECSAA
jgi:DNA-binding Lrp family transcriptional regulator